MAITNKSKFQEKIEKDTSRQVDALEQFINKMLEEAKSLPITFRYDMPSDEDQNIITARYKEANWEILFTINEVEWGSVTLS
jgi:hypothetical protein